MQKIQPEIADTLIFIVIVCGSCCCMILRSKDETLEDKGWQHDRDGSLSISTHNVFNKIAIRQQKTVNQLDLNSLLDMLEDEITVVEIQEEDRRWNRWRQNIPDNSERSLTRVAGCHALNNRRQMVDRVQSVCSSIDSEEYKINFNH